MTPCCPSSLRSLPPPDPVTGGHIIALRDSHRPVAVALSAGADSSAALLWATGQFDRTRLLALHYHHNVRGAAADADLAQARELARSLGVAFSFEKRSSGAPANEAALRTDRLAFFMRAIRAAGAAALIQGHHADDVAESLLMRLGRGAGSAGLAAPRPSSRLPDGTLILRPLLSLRKAALETALREAHLSWRHDESNDDPSVATRNRIRNQVVRPWANALPGDAIAAASRTRALLQEDDDAINEWANRLLTDLTHGQANPTVIRIPTPPPPRAVLRRLIHTFTLRNGCPTPTAHAMDTLLASLQEAIPCALTLGANTGLRIQNGTLAIVHSRQPARPREETTLPIPGAAFWPDGASLLAEFVCSEIPPGNGICVHIKPPEAPVLRCSPRLPGERYRPLGASGSQKLQDTMVNRKIPAQRRNTLPVVRDASDILWCPGLPPSEKTRLSSNEMRPLRLTWTPPTAA